MRKTKKAFNYNHNNTNSTNVTTVAHVVQYNTLYKERLEFMFIH